MQNQTNQVPSTHQQQIPTVNQSNNIVLPSHQTAVSVPNSQTPHQVQQNFTDYTNIQKNNIYSNEILVGSAQQYPSSGDIISGSTMPNMYNIPPNSTSTVTSGSFGTSCTPVTHHQERAALQQQLQELYCMPPASENQEKIVSIQEKITSFATT